MIIATFRIETETVDLLKGHQRLMALLDVLEPVFDRNSWFRVPHTAKENAKPWIPCIDEDRFLRQTARDMGEDQGPWSEAVGGYSALVTTASNQSSWDELDRTVIDFSPWRGTVRIEMSRPSGDAATVYARTRDCFMMACTQLDVLYASCDFARSPRPDGARGQTYYGIDRRVFPHREFLGWMGFVKRPIETHEIPEADELIPLVEKGGSMIVAVANAFDVHNPDHVEKAQRVEMRLVDLDVLPVTDPRFL